MAKIFRVEEKMEVRAPVERCFTLATRVEIVAMELGMRPVEGRISGAVADGDRVRWTGWKFGLPQVHVSVIEDFRVPVFFRDRMLEGRFRAFEHDHWFRELGDGWVEMHDEVRFSMRWGWIGEVVGRTVMEPHIRGLMRRRFARLKRMAEGDEWTRFIE